MGGEEGRENGRQAEGREVERGKGIGKKGEDGGGENRRKSRERS